jgi:hypothetical protein
MHGEVDMGDSLPISLSLLPRQGEPSAFETTFTVDKPGLHSVRVWSGEQDPKNLRAATLHILVELPNLEYDQPVQDLATLQTIARVSGGEVFQLADAAKAVDVFKIRRAARTLEDRQEIWDAPVLFGIMLAALIAEWILRKKVRLV